MSESATPHIVIRLARREDLPAIVRLIADDQLGRVREDLSDLRVYEEAFAAMGRQEGNMQLVAELGGAVVGCLQLTLIHGISRKGTTRGQIEAVRVDARHRGHAIGARLMEDAIRRCREAQCRLVQLTTDKQRLDAQRFYERLGFTPSHIGMKLSLD